MPTYYHPNAVRDTVDDVDGAVSLGGETIDIDEDGTLECSEAQASTLARMYDVEVSDLRADGESGGAELVDANDKLDNGMEWPEDVCGTEMSDGSTCERPADECPYHGD